MIREGTKVKWSRPNGSAQGRVENVYYHNVFKTINGEEKKLRATRECPAYLIKKSDGQPVLKSCTEVREYDPLKTQ